MAQDKPIVDDPVIDPITNEVAIPIEDVPLSIIPQPEPEPEPEPVPTGDPFASETPVEQSLSQKESQALRVREIAIEKERAELDKDKAGVTQNRAQQDRLSRYTAQYGEQAAREMVQDQQNDQTTHDAEVASLRSEQRFNEEKQRGITELAQQYGVDPNFLSKFDSRDSMEAGAIERAARIRDKAEAVKVQEGFEKRLSLVEGKTVEDGAFDSASSSGSTPLTPTQLLTKSGSDSSFEMTPAQQKLVTEYLGL